MRLVLLLFLMAFSALRAEAAKSPASVDLVDASGRQRMLSQRIAKAYAQIGVNVAPAESRRLLQESIAQFSRQQERLRAEVVGAEPRAALADADRLWQELHAVATGPVARSEAELLQERANELQRACHRVAMLIAEDSGTPISRLVNLAGRQRMLSQRMAKAFMLRAWGLESSRLLHETEVARGEFGAALQLLMQAPENTAEIRDELEGLAIQWEWLQNALALEGALSYRLLVADTSEAVLASLEKLVALYVRLGHE